VRIDESLDGERTMLTTLCERAQTLLHQQRGVEDNEAVAQRQDIVGRPFLQEGSDRTL
jgi:hypothetical protein